MQLLVLLNVFDKLDRIEHATTREFVESPLSGVENELFLLHWQFLACVYHDKRELFAVVRLVEVHERHEVIQVSLVLCVENLIFVVVHLIGISELRQLLEEVVALLLLDLEFAVLDIEIKDTPDIVRLQFRNEFILSVSRDVRNVAILRPEQLEDLAYFEFGL